jgi:tetratricopeptide (TPR) repeat protein
MLGVGALLAWAMIRYKIPITAVFAVLVALAVRSVLQEPVWQNSRTLFNNALAVNPASVQSCDNLGFIAGRDARRLADAGKTADARPFFDESIQWYLRSLRNAPTNVLSMYNLALDYQRIGRLDLGRGQIRRIVQLQPQLPREQRVDPPVHLATLLVEFGDLPGAIDWLDQIIQRDPNNLQAVQLRLRAEQMLQHPATRLSP